MNRQLVSVTDAVPYQEFAKLIGKTPRAVRGMIEKGKLPVIEITDPQSVSGRAGEYWVYLPAWNNGLKLAYESRPKEIRDGWLMWLGLGDSGDFALYISAQGGANVPRDCQTVRVARSPSDDVNEYPR